jgi:transcriptional regulator with XRE-family HTH domain
MRSRAPTLNQVAALAGVSHQTVSRVLNHHANVSANTRARVLAAIHQLDYQPNTAARTLVTDRSQTIGLITFDGTLAGPSSIVWAIQQAARQAGYFVSIANRHLLRQRPDGHRRPPRPPRVRQIRSGERQRRRLRRPARDRVSTAAADDYPPRLRRDRPSQHPPPDQADHRRRPKPHHPYCHIAAAGRQKQHRTATRQQFQRLKERRMSHPTRVSAPVDLTDVPGGRPVPAGTALDLGAWDVRILSTENERQR